jgi:hypothetical protein
MRKKGENSVKCAGKSAIPPDKIMMSPLVSKVNNPPHLADFAARYDCSVAAPADSWSCRSIPNAVFANGVRGVPLDSAPVLPNGSSELISVSA